MVKQCRSKRRATSRKSCLRWRIERKSRQRYLFIAVTVCAVKWVGGWNVYTHDPAMGVCVVVSM